MSIRKQAQSRTHQSKGLITGQFNQSSTRKIVEQFRQTSIKRSQIDKKHSRVPLQFGLSSPKLSSKSSTKSMKQINSDLAFINHTAVIQSATRKLILWAGNANSVGWTSFIRLGILSTIFYFYLNILNQLF